MIYDISKMIDEGMEVYEGDPEVTLEEVFTIAKDGFSLRRIEMSTHTGTHLDAPSHFIEKGKSIDKIDLDVFFGNAQVALTFEDEIPKDTKRLLGKNGYLSEKRALELVRSGLKLIGTVNPSIELDSTEIVHEILLGNGIIILENLNLQGIKEGNYTLAAFPLKINGADGSPVRAVLMDDLRSCL
ncbi:MAG: cyclase family protein [Clostridiaceae bacterium]